MKAIVRYFLFGGYGWGIPGGALMARGTRFHPQVNTLGRGAAWAMVDRRRRQGDIISIRERLRLLWRQLNAHTVGQVRKFIAFYLRQPYVWGVALAAFVIAGTAGPWWAKVGGVFLGLSLTLAATAVRYRTLMRSSHEERDGAQD